MKCKKVGTPTLQNNRSSVSEFVGVKKFIPAHLHIVCSLTVCSWQTVELVPFECVYLLIDFPRLFFLFCFCSRFFSHELQGGHRGENTLARVRGQLEINFHICKQSFAFPIFCPSCRTEKNIQHDFHRQRADFLRTHQFVRAQDFMVTVWQRYTLFQCDSL